VSTPAQRRRFKQVDVFTGVPFKGNPLAVVLDANGLSDARMQAIARWTNLSETTFVLAPTVADADYRVRIFSPGGEFPFAGHPTLGTAHALLEHGLAPRVPGRLVQECAVGLVPIDLSGKGLLAFRAPPATLQALPEQFNAAVTRGLGTDAWIACGTPLVARMGIGWLLVELPSAEACLALKPDAAALFELTRSGVAGVAVFGPHDVALHEEPADIEVRAFFDKNGALAEDPVTGSANACIAWALAARRPGGYTARQGTCVQCDGRIAVSYRDGAPWIGGHSVTVIDGTLSA
jgi:PhzF family phenazine biosynthesis protein